MSIQQPAIQEGDTVKWSGDPATVEHVDHSEQTAEIIVDSPCKTTHGFREVNLTSIEPA